MVHKVKETVLNALFPSNIICDICGVELDMTLKYSLCTSCYKAIRKINEEPFRCSCCDKPVERIHEQLESYYYKCKECQEKFSFYQCHRTFAHYEGTMKKILMAIKYHGKTHHISFLVDSLYAVVQREFSQVQFDGIVSVPIHFTRKLSRQFNQAELLADALSEKMKVKHFKALKRVKRTKRLKLLSRQERKNVLKNAILLKSAYKNQILGKNILIIDDIYTTGVTVNSCAQVLYENGVSNSYVLTVATGY